MMNESKGNMYPWVTHTWNAIRGRCPHDCSYCFMKLFKVGELRLDARAINDDLGEGNIIFVGSSTDMWAEEVPREWINRVLEHCRKYSNMYLFQSKNPERFFNFIDDIPKNCIIGTTIESNRATILSKAPAPTLRFDAMQKLAEQGFKTMISVEPVMDFDIAEMFSGLRKCNPSFISIGADSQNHKLPEPDAHKILFLIEQLEQAKIIVKQKDNLKRLIKNETTDKNKMGK